MTFNHRKSVTYRLVQAARVHRTRAAVHLGRIGLHPGQEAVLKALAERDGYYYELQDFIAGIERGQLSGIVTPESAAESVNICREEIRSVTENREITL